MCLHAPHALKTCTCTTEVHICLVQRLSTPTHARSGHIGAQSAQYLLWPVENNRTPFLPFLTEPAEASPSVVAADPAASDLLAPPAPLPPKEPDLDVDAAPEPQAPGLLITLGPDPPGPPADAAMAPGFAPHAPPGAGPSAAVGP
mmetsp:Transcript_15034/g.32586  ORF Transcript_15034/g.32586 Transcript_15034/m.32586 type:complete len:145 (-) Transcript_15034:1011-1445(-)